VRKTRTVTTPVGDTLTKEQIANIVALITETGSDKAKFLAYMKAKTLEEIPQTAYSTMVKLLEAKRARS
jgi:hypothetical protein